MQEFSLSEGGYKLASFDQFRENKEKYNYQSKYDEKFYTTQLDKNKITDTQREETERLVKEIEGQGSKNFHVAEERGGDVDGADDD